MCAGACARAHVRACVRKRVRRRAARRACVDGARLRECRSATDVDPPGQDQGTRDPRALNEGGAPGAEDHHTNGQAGSVVVVRIQPQGPPDPPPSG